MAQCRPADVQWLDYLDYDGSPMLLIKRSDPHAKEIIAGSHHVAVLTCNHETKEWLETYPQASVFIYSRNVEPKHVLCLLDHTSGSLELILLTSVKKFHFDAPCLFLKDEFGLIRCFQFITKDDYKRIGKLVHYIMYRSQQETKYVSLLSLLADAQGIFDNSDQSIQDNTALSPETRTTTESSNVMNTLRNVRNERNEKVPPYESVTPASLPLYESVTPTASPTFDIPYHASNIPPNATTLPASSKYISNFLNPAVNHVNKSSDVVKKQTLNQANQVIPPLVRKVPTSSNISAKHKAKYKMNNAVPSFSRTTSTSSAMSSLEAVNAAMEHDLYQVDNRIRIPSYSSISSDSASSACSMTTASTRSMTSASTRSMTTDDVPKKRKSAAPIRVDQLEKRQKTVVSFLSATSPNQPKLCSPLMFMERNTLPKEINASTTTNERTGVFRISKSKRHDGNPESYTQNSTTHLPSTEKENKTEQEHKSEPLTQNQLLQAVSHLIRTDESFMHKLHAAYLESFIDILPKTN